MTIRVADYIAQTLVAHGIQDVFLVTGGGAMHLNDALGHHPKLRHWPCHHEQTCSMAAESYFRITRRMAAVNVTTGPGGTNAITGVYGAYVDSQAMIVLSGQVKWDTCMRSTELPLRQLGDQEVDITRLVESITKYAVMVTDPLSIRYHLERALHLALQGRPGPVWLDIPIHIQSSLIEPENLEGYDPAEDGSRVAPTGVAQAGAVAVMEALYAAKRPVILGGSGLWTGKAEGLFRELADRLELPFVTAFNGHDLLPSTHPHLVGRQGTIGDRPGNFAVQNADFLLILGSRMNIRQIGYNWNAFAPGAFVAMVDADAAELKKPTLRVDLPILGDLEIFLKRLLALTESGIRVEAHRDYLAWCQERRIAYPVVLPGYWEKSSPINPYCFTQALFHLLRENEIIVCANATACIAPFQAAVVKEGQRLFSNSGSAPMGFDLPAAIGAAVATQADRIICLAGDGSIMMNLQELQTIAHHGLPVKIFLLNNNGYHSIRQTQNNYFADPKVGIDPGSGVGFPDFQLLAHAHGLGYQRIQSHDEMAAGIAECLGMQGALICEVVLDPDQPFAPRVASRRLEDGRMVSASLDDMAPFLSPEELAQNRSYINQSSNR